jgi:eukaryotic-like serine/threonine-protein kinase
MSTVYAARDRRFVQVERLCAVKEMFEIDPDARARAMRLMNFERESALLAMLSHPAIPRIYDYFIVGGLVYLVLEYVDGQDLERYLANRNSPCSEDQIIRWALEITDVLETLHGQEPDPIIFRDLKPSNIMLRNTGQLVLIDFGIARTIQGRQRGTMIGTEGYAPPEQYRGIADARGDIYALGATLHHLATNSDPRIETPFTFQERPVRSLNPDISEELSAVIMKTLAYNPVDRYQTVTDLRQDLLEVQRRSTIARYESTSAEVVSPPAEDTHQPDDPAEDHGSAEGAVQVVRRPQSPRKAASKKRAARRRRAAAGDMDDRTAWSTATGDEVRGSATFDGHAFMIGSYDGHLYSVSASDGAVRWKFRTGRGVVGRPVVYKGCAIFGSEDHSIYSIDRTTCSLRWSFRTGMPVRSSPVVIGERVIVGSDDGWVYCISGETGDQLWRHRTWGPVRSSPAALESSIVVGSDDSHVYHLAAENGELLWRAPCGGPIQSAPTTVTDRVIATSRGGFVSAISLETGARLWHYDASVPVLSSPRVAGSVAIFGAVDGSVHGLDVHDGSARWTTQLANQITASALAVDNVAYLGTVDGDCVCFSTETGDVHWRHAVGAGIVSTPAYGNGVMVVGSIDGRIYGLNLSDAEIARLEGGSI